VREREGELADPKKKLKENQHGKKEKGRKGCRI
jgi:hypothetical protein